MKEKIVKNEKISHYIPIGDVRMEQGGVSWYIIYIFKESVGK